MPVASIDPATGLASFLGVTQRPFAGWIRVQGSLPEPEVCDDVGKYEYRVEVDTGSGLPTLSQPGIVHPASDNWRRTVRGGGGICPASPNDTYDSDSDGWFAVADYRRFDGCGSDPSLAVWNSSGMATDKDDDDVVVRFRVVMREIGAASLTFASAPVSARLDNHRIQLPDSLLPADSATGDTWFDVYRQGESSALGDQCRLDGEGGPVVLDLRGRVNDAYFWYYEMRWSGGFAAGSRSMLAPGDLNAFDDGRPDLTDTGTQPGTSNTVPLELGFDLVAAYTAATGAALPDVCGYAFWLRAGTGRSSSAGTRPRTTSTGSTATAAG